MGEYFFTAFDNYTLFHSTAYMGGTAGFLPVSNVDTIKEKNFQVPWIKWMAC
jgi:hypothetical protein